MEFRLGIEDIEPGNWVAWVFELLGCYARGSTREEAISLAPTSIEELQARLSQSRFLTNEARPPFSVVIAEEFRASPSSPDYIVNAFFDNDRIPLTDDDINYASSLLSLNRRDLMSIVSRLSEDTLDWEISGEIQKNIRGILRHIGTAEWWYWDRLGLVGPRQELPDSLAELLGAVREFTLQHLPELVGSIQTSTRLGEQWSPRKLLRRSIWHERVHTLQIARYLKDAPQ